MSPGGLFSRLRATGRLWNTLLVVLDATVVGRSLPLDPDEVLIQSHALLAPSR